MGIEHRFVCRLFWNLSYVWRGALSPVSTTEELLGRNSTCSGLENRQYGRRSPQRWPRDNIKSTKVGTNFPAKRWWHGRYSSLTDYGYKLILLLSYIRQSCVSSCIIKLIVNYFCKNTPTLSVYPLKHFNRFMDFHIGMEADCKPLRSCHSYQHQHGHMNVQDRMILLSWTLLCNSPWTYAKRIRLISV
jgi:hypothetical protein